MLCSGPQVEAGVGMVADAGAEVHACKQRVASARGVQNALLHTLLDTLLLAGSPMWQVGSSLKL